MPTYNFEVDFIHEDERIDSFLAAVVPDCTRSYLQKIIKQGNVIINNKPCVKAGTKLSEGDQIEIDVPCAMPLDIVSENIPLSILFEDRDFIIVDKPKQMVVHPSAGHQTGTLVNALLYYCKDELSGINGVLRPGIVHRIDQNTTGALVVCKNDVAHKYVAELLKEHTVTRRYYAICHGNLKSESGTIDLPIGRSFHDRKKMAVNYANGRNAVTHYRVIEHLKGYDFIECELETGRTHQIRVHMAHIGHPLLGDDIYCSLKSKFNLTGQTLHAYVIGFVHPTTHEYLEVNAPLPDYFEKLLKILRQ